MDVNGLHRGIVNVENHNPTWKDEAEKTIDLLKRLLKDDIIDVQHVGSTSINEIVAKPIIDIVVGVKDFQDIMRYNEILQENGIIYRKREHGNQLLYVCGDISNEMISHHIHVVIWNDNEWNNYLNFRDYLNCHLEDALAYSKLKEELAKIYSDNRGFYTVGKQDMINNILAKADKWRNE